MNSTTLNTWIALLFLLVGISTDLSAQSVTSSVDKTSIFIGEQITMKLSVTGVRQGINWINYPDSINHLEIVERGKIDTVESNGSYNYYQLIKITSFDSGSWTFPSLVLPEIARATNPVTIEVKPVDISGMKDYNEIKEIEEVALLNNKIIIAIIAVITLIAIAMVVILLLKKKKAAAYSTANITGNQTPIEWAIAELEKLKNNKLQTQQEAKQYYSSLTGISRQFFNLQLQQKNLQQTTDEWMLSLQSLSVDNDSKISFFQFLRLADTVKFAKYLPPVNDNQNSLNSVEQMLRNVALLHSPVYSKYQPKTN